MDNKKTMEQWVIDEPYWKTGATMDEFVSKMQTNQQDMRRRIKGIAFTSEEISGLGSLAQDVFVVVMSEDWCGDSLMNLPILFGLSNLFPRIKIRIFARGEHPDLRAYFAAHGVINIPAFLFLDENFQEMGVWVERPKRAYPRLAEWKLQYPEMEVIRSDESLSREERRERLKPYTQKLNQEMEGWYSDDLQCETVSEIRAILLSGEKHAQIS